MNKSAPIFFGCGFFYLLVSSDFEKLILLCLFLPSNSSHSQVPSTSDFTRHLCSDSLKAQVFLINFIRVEHEKTTKKIAASGTGINSSIKHLCPRRSISRDQRSH